ncbi:FxsB family cyclophane-forming radical SAM/SPASM peptide maturase [Amycolatopsis sp. lyj-109]|uniref:FxsB family cyclophane-forming radical SAM/SPASM peptide maturase n=1 Tax=Amycolatopsis sp. lyj-109 TaxID=2789287 RepID=UPI00397B5883
MAEQRATGSSCGGKKMKESWPIPPRPLRQFVIKVHSRCNLTCDYCYVYTMADQGWRTRPKVLSDELVDITAGRIAEHARHHGLPEIRVVLHGGEPMLAGTAALARCVRTVRAALGSRVHALVTVQTNGTLLTERRVRCLAELGVRFGVSLDGLPRSQDRRRDRRGRSSHAVVVDRLRLFREPDLRPYFAGILATIDLAADPVATYEALIAHEPPMIDFLLPHGNWTTPPPGRPLRSPATPYGDWLIAAFDRWYGAPVRETGVRMFEEIIHGLFGGTPRVEGLGLAPLGMAVVETDGSIELSDTLKSTYPGAAATGLHIRSHSFDDVLELPVVRAQQLGKSGLPAACEPCDVARVCGGGLRAHRYRAGTGFANPSVYSPDLGALIRHVREALRRDVTALRTAGAAR